MAKEAMKIEDGTWLTELVQYYNQDSPKVHLLRTNQRGPRTTPLLSHADTYKYALLDGRRVVSKIYAQNYGNPEHHADGDVIPSHIVAEWLYESNLQTNPAPICHEDPMALLIGIALKYNFYSREVEQRLQVICRGVLLLFIIREPSKNSFISIIFYNFRLVIVQHLIEPSQLLESDSSEDEESRPRTPPQSRKRGPPAYVSPDRSRLAKVLAVGGQLDVTASATPLGSERVEFYAIEPPSLHELLDPELQHLSRFTCTPDEASQGFLAIQSNLSIGCGTFKNAHRGWITLHHLRDAVLGTTKSELVVVKRTFRELSKKSGGQTAYTRYSSPEEHKIILKEANNLYWAISIMGFSYSYIYSFDSLHHPDCPPIPDLRFVQAGVAIYYETPAKNSSKASIRKTYLLEKYIETNSDSEFVKFVHNGSAAPLLDIDDAWRWIADFLCFTQHIQYWKSGEMVFLSDLQGSDILLTDPQIMTSPKIAEGADLFADGNVGAVFEQFPDQHVCNQYCEWFKLPVL
ncbi:hypothetical protein R3P38DRAFT_3371236 [Favolaschia claudopus]|uniref:Alpha-type protein kinase domain-containing protein n=1 Tax=Favolaschia claudopus TaxID=2862362 RepID=A0AAV9ZYA8_9AGAR